MPGRIRPVAFTRGFFGRIRLRGIFPRFRHYRLGVQTDDDVQKNIVSVFGLIKKSGRWSHYMECPTNEPEVAKNIVAVAILACTRPPVIHDSQRSSATYVRSATPPHTKISPISTKSGIVIRLEDAEADHTT